MKNREFRLLQLFAEDPAGGQDGEIPKGQDEGTQKLSLKWLMAFSTFTRIL